MSFPGPVTARARAMLDKAELAARDFLALFENLRKGKRGNSTDPEQDLLRAMLVFAAAGLDATIKQLTRDALPPLLELPNGEHAQGSLEQFALRRLRDADRPDLRFLAQLVATPDLHNRLVKAWIEDLTDGSMQSIEAVQKAANAFGIETIFSSNEDRNAVKSAFGVRNDIIHEMDLDPGAKFTFSKARQRHQRSRDEMIAHTEVIQKTATRFLEAVEALLSTSARSGPHRPTTPESRL